MTDDKLIEQIESIITQYSGIGTDLHAMYSEIADLCKAHYRKNVLDEAIYAVMELFSGKEFLYKSQILRTLEKLKDEYNDKGE